MLHKSESWMQIVKKKVNDCGPAGNLPPAERKSLSYNSRLIGWSSSQGAEIIATDHHVEKESGSPTATNVTSSS